MLLDRQMEFEHELKVPVADNSSYKSKLKSR